MAEEILQSKRLRTWKCLFYQDKIYFILDHNLNIKLWDSSRSLSKGSEICCNCDKMAFLGTTS